MATRIGRQMRMVAEMAARGPVARIDVAAAVGPHSSLCYGYQTVQRAVRAGLVRLAAPLPGRRGATLVLASVAA